MFNIATSGHFRTLAMFQHLSDGLQVSLWYSDHSTSNPLGVKPDPAITRIVIGDKFTEEGVEILQPPDNLSGKSHSIWILLM